MKKLLMALTVIGTMSYSANAQSTKSQFDKNYPVCEGKDGKGVICTKAQMEAQIRNKRVHVQDVDAKGLPVADKALSETNQVVFVRCQSAVDESPNTYVAPNRHHILVNYDNMDNPYKGLPSQQYDGPAKNDERNINVNQTSINLPPNSGYTANR